MIKSEVLPGQKGLGISPILIPKGGSCKGMNGAGEEKSCGGKGGLLLLLIFADKKSDERGLELLSISIEKSLCYEGI